jgi:hypothetical protein
VPGEFHDRYRMSVCLEDLALWRPFGARTAETVDEYDWDGHSMMLTVAPVVIA